MKKLKWSILALLPMLTGWGAYIPYNKEAGSFSIEGEWIYFSPTSETVYFAQDFITFAAPGSVPVPEPNGTKHANRFDQFHSGWKLGAAYCFCQCDAYLSLSYSQLVVHHDKSLVVPNPTLQNTVLPGVVANSTYQTANAHKKFNYYSLEGVIGESLIDNCCGVFDVFAGIHYAHLLTRESYSFIRTAFLGLTANAEGTLVNSFWGIGPELGIALDQSLGCNFSFLGRLTGAFLIGEPKASVEATSLLIQTTPTAVTRIADLDLKDETAWRVVPYGNIKLGIAYHFCFPCNFRSNARGINVSIEAGYEALSYFDGLARLRVASTESGLNFDEYRNVTMHGPYVAANLSF